MEEGFSVVLTTDYRLLTTEEKAAGEFHATKLMTHRPGPTQADGLHTEVKASFMIKQTERENKYGGTKHVLEQETNIESQYGSDVCSLPSVDWQQEC